MGETLPAKAKDVSLIPGLGEDPTRLQSTWACESQPLTLRQEPEPHLLSPGAAGPREPVLLEPAPAARGDAAARSPGNRNGESLRTATETQSRQVSNKCLKE